MQYNAPYGSADPNADFLNGNPATGVAGSIIPAAAVGFPQREIVNAITASGQTAENSNLNQLTSAIELLGRLPVVMDVGTINNIVVNPIPVIAAYTDLLIMAIQVAYLSTGPVTINVSGLGAIPLQRPTGAPLIADDLPAGGIVIVACSGTAFQLLSTPCSLFGAGIGVGPAGPTGATGPAGPTGPEGPAGNFRLTSIIIGAAYTATEYNLYIEQTAVASVTTTLLTPAGSSAEYIFWNNSTSYQTVATPAGAFVGSDLGSGSAISVPPGGFAQIESDTINWVVTSIVVANTGNRGIARQATLTEYTNGVTTGSVPAFVTPEGLAPFLAANLTSEYVVAAGPTNAWTATLEIPPASLTDGLSIRVQFPGTNTAIGPQINVDGGGLATIYLTDASTPLPIGWLPIEAVLQWSTTAAAWICLNPQIGTSDTLGKISLVQTYAGNPNGHVAGSSGTPGVSPPSLCWDSTDAQIWVCSTTGSTSSAVWSATNKNYPDFVFNTNISPAIPSTGALRFYDTASSGIQVVTASFSGSTPYQTILSAINLNGAAMQFETPGNVYVNFPALSGGSVASFSTLISNGVAQGCWENPVTNVTFGKIQTLPSGTTGFPYFTSVAFTATQVVIAYIGTTNTNSLVVLNPITGAIGASATITPAGGNCMLFQTASNAGVLFYESGSTVYAQPFSISGSTITLNSAVALTGVGMKSICQIGSAPSINFVGMGYGVSGSSFYLTVLPFSVSGSTVTLGTAVHSSNLPGSYVSGPQTDVFNVWPVSSTTVIFGGQAANGTNAELFIATYTAGATPSVVIGTGLSVGHSLTGIAATGNSGSFVGINALLGGQGSAVAISVSGTTITSGSFVNIGPSAGAGVLFVAQTFGVDATDNPYGCYSSGVWQYTQIPGQFLWNDTTIYPFMVSGTTITAGTALNAGAINTVMGQAPDGTWAYSEQSAASVTKLFSVAGNAVVGGSLIANAQALGACAWVYSATLAFGYYLVGGTWFQYVIASDVPVPITSSIGIGIVTPNTLSVITNFS